MRPTAWAFLLLLSLLLTSGREPSKRVIHVSTAEELQAALRERLENVTVQLAPGTYALKPTEAFEPSTNYCGANSALVPATVGLTMTGKRVRLLGPRDGEAIVVANGGYGIYFKDCEDCDLDGLTVTGIELDSGATSSYGAIVATNSKVRIANCVIDYNATDPQWRTATALPVGLCLREGADIVVEFNEFIGNTAGVRMFNGSHAVLRNNWFLPSDTTAAGGGIDVACNAIATVERNLFQGSSGVLMAGQSALTCRGNLFESGALAIGVSGTGTAIVEKNVVYKSGGVGVQIADAATGRVSSNILVANCVAMYTTSPGSALVIRGNTLYDNVQTGNIDDGNGTRETFWRARRNWTRTYRNNGVGVDGRYKFHESAFLTRYGRWMD